MSQRANHVTVCAALSLLLGGALVCIGWELRISILKGESFGTFVSPNAALLFILVGTSCLLQLSSKNLAVRAGQVVAVVISFVAAAFLAEYLLSADFGIDTRFLSNRLGDWTVRTPPGRPALMTIVAFFSAGLGLIGLRTQQARHVTDWCAALVASVSYLGIVGYGYGLPKLYGGVMALPTSVLLGIVALALCTGRADSIVTSKEAGGVAFRRVITPLLVLMPLLGFLRIRIQQRFSLSTEMSTALLVVVTVFLFAAITAHTAGVLNELDIKRKRFEESLIRAEKLAAAGRLSATIAHEVNNPLAAVMNLLYLARTADSEPTKAEYIRAAEDEVRRAAEIAKRTLGFYRDDTRPSDVGLGALAGDVVELFRKELAASQIKVDTHLEHPTCVRARPGEVRQIISNLLRNSIDAVQKEEEPRITVALRETLGLAELVVSDNGCGIPSEQLHRIFEPFFTTKKDVGTGLGLYMSRQLAEKNNGSLSVESRTQPAQRGTTFRLTFPAAISMRERPEPSSLAAGQSA